MKTICRFFILCLGVVALFSCEKPVTPPVLDVETHYDMVYMLGAAPGQWDSMDPLPMNATDDPDIFEYELDLVRSAENKLIKFSISVDSWDKAKFLVPATVEEGFSYCFLKEGINELSETSVAKEGEGNLRDHFFGLDKNMSGTYLLRVNPVELTLEATKLEAIEDPEIVEWVEGTIYMVGDATPNGWDIANPTPMVHNGNIHTYEGPLNAGTMKFPTKFSWDCETYRPATDMTTIGEEGISDENVVMWIEDVEAGKLDHKWEVTKAGNYKLVLDTENMKMTVEWKGE